MKTAKTVKNLNAAVKAKSFHRVKEILDCGVKPDNSSCFLAIERRSHEILKALIKGGADVNALEPYWNRTPLVKAIKLEDKSALAILLTAGASPNLNCNGGPPLIALATTGWVEGVKALIERGVDLEQQNSAENTPLIIAARMGHLAVVKLLVEAGANPLAADMLDRTAYDVALEEKREAIAEYLAPLCAAKKPLKKSALELLLGAIKKEDAAAFKKHLAACADVNGQDKFGRLPLSCAIESGSVEFVERLLDAGADPARADALEYSVQRGEKEILRVLLERGVETNPSGSTLRTACAMGNADVVKMLLNVGSDPNATTEPGADTPLMMAAQALSPEIIQALIDKGADVNRSNRDGWTALFNAVFAPSIKYSQIKHQGGSKLMWAETEPNPNADQSATDVVKLLLDSGADVNHKNKDGRTPVTYASSPRIANLLLRAGAKLDTREKQGHNVSYWLKKNGLSLTGTSTERFSTVANKSAKHPLGRRSSKGRRQ